MIQGMKAARNPTDTTLRKMRSQVILAASLILTRVSILPAGTAALYTRAYPGSSGLRCEDLMPLDEVAEGYLKTWRVLTFEGRRGRTTSFGAAAEPGRTPRLRRKTNPMSSPLPGQLRVWRETSELSAA